MYVSLATGLVTRSGDENRPLGSENEEVSAGRLFLALVSLGLTGALASPMLSPAPAVPALSVRSEADPVTVATTILRGPATTPKLGVSYRYSAVYDGKPVRWNPCTALHWRFRTVGAPTGALAVVKAAVARIASASGTTWRYDGTSTATPGTGWLPKTSNSVPPVLIGWTDAGHSDLLRGAAKNVLGMTRTSWLEVDDHRGHRAAAIRAAVIALDRTDSLPLTGRASWKAVLLHELGHAMGLAHATDGHQLMYPVLSPGLTDLQAGDLAGLVKVGRTAGCITLPSLG